MSIEYRLESQCSVSPQHHHDVTAQNCRIIFEVDGKIRDDDQEMNSRAADMENAEDKKSLPNHEFFSEH